jgi:CRP/FNR family transcriptional regulator, cyclic AMP receptor protein
MGDQSGLRAERSWPRGTFLSILPTTSRANLIDMGIICTFPPNHVLLRQGDPGSSVWLLLDALVKVTAAAENGSQTLLAVRLSGDLVGEMAVIDGSSRHATVSTCGRAVVCQIKGPQFVEYLRRDAAASIALNQQAIWRLRWSNQRRLDFAGYETSVCLARLLLALAARHGSRGPDGVEIGAPLTQAELGSLVGAKEGTVQKALRELAARGLVMPRHRSVTIVDVAGLMAFADLPAQ